MLVGGRAWVWEDDHGVERWHFTPLRTWMGSANWTAFASSHLKFGLWSDDRALLDRNLAFLLDLVRFAQPLDSRTAGPEPELVDATWDDAAFAEHYRESGWDGPDPGDDDEGRRRPSMRIVSASGLDGDLSRLARQLCGCPMRRTPNEFTGSWNRSRACGG